MDAYREEESYASQDPQPQQICPFFRSRVLLHTSPRSELGQNVDVRYSEFERFACLGTSAELQLGHERSSPATTGGDSDSDSDGDGGDGDGDGGDGKHLSFTYQSIPLHTRVYTHIYTPDVLVRPNLALSLPL